MTDFYLHQKNFNEALYKLCICVIISILALTSCKKKPNGEITVTTKTITEITENSAKSGGSVFYPGGITIAECGICYGKSTNPTIDDSYTEDQYGEGSFTSILNNLESETKYYVRAYAKTSSGIKYGNQESFTTPFVTPDPPIGAIKGLFSVSETQRVWFSQGNLQYIGSASIPYWKFADNQWLAFSSSEQNGDSPNIDRDLFGWGTSGYNHGAICYQPWSTSEDWNDYHVYGDYRYNLYDRTGKADWGYNAIKNGGNTTNTWRTLTTWEWRYVFNSRNTVSRIRYAKALVNGIRGVILLPDDWNAEYFSLNSTNTSNAEFSSNTITTSQWVILEQHGAVFLPSTSYSSGSSGSYWSSSAYHYGPDYSDRLAHSVWFYGTRVLPDSQGNRDSRYCVRLVQNYN